MSGFTNVQEILDFAIISEQNAVDLYLNLANRSKTPSAKAAFEEYAAEERGHKAKLERVKSGKKLLLKPSAKVQDLKLSDYTVLQELGENPDYQSILIFAMHQEKAAFKLYTDLSQLAESAEIKDLLLGLAQEEAKHKLRFEIEYDEHVLIEN